MTVQSSAAQGGLVDTSWYYAEGAEQIGPLSLSDVRAALSRILDASGVLIWRYGFSDWQLAKNVPELADIVIKPPPLPSNPPPVPAPALPSFSSKSENKENPPSVRKEPVGIGGWLMLVALGQVLSPLKFSVSALMYFSGLDASWWTMYPIAFYGEAILYMSTLAIFVYTACLFFKTSKRFPRFYIYASIAAVLLVPLDVIWSSTTLNAYTGKSMDQLIASMMTPDVVGQWIVTILSAAIWIPYICRSKRVANTFSPREDVGLASPEAEWSDSDQEKFRRLVEHRQNFSPVSSPA
jgi:hypothetical protein